MSAQQMMMLRIQLYGAAQTCEGDELREFWTLLDEVEKIRPDEMADARYKE